uniref:Uncharacterized protein n=1 Tax=Meloidogyne enterolobii TaxID=390850 RepID=A0A6V7U3E3_MELEN|nr:unnamed protein product [Meloidogyne enterolobii]
MKWPPQGTNLDLIEMLWICVDEHIKSKTPKTEISFSCGSNEAWLYISNERV